MNLPTQSTPVQRISLSRPFARPGDSAHGLTRGQGEGSTGYSECGIQANDTLSDILGVAGPILGTVLKFI